MSKSKSTPAIRFAGFTDAWEQRKVGDTITEVSRPIEMKDDQIYQLVTVKRRNEGITSRGFFYGSEILVKTYFEVHEGDYLISKRQLVHGANGQVPKSLDKSIVSNEYMTCVGNEVLTAEFLTLLSKTENLKRDFFLSSYGVDIEKLVFDVNDWKKRYLLIPKIDEQNALCSFFNHLDALITLHQRKYDKLVKVKKAMLEKMFPKGDAKVPEIRFMGFTDPWEQRKLKDTFDFLQNNTLSRADLSLDSGVAKNIHYGDVLIKFGEYLDATKTALPFITSQQIAEKYKSSILQDGDIIMADTAEDETVGKCTEIVNLQGFPAISGLHTIPLRPKDNFATGFLGYYMNSETYHNQLLPLMQGIKVTSISKGALQDTVISFPSDVAEQAAIGQHFIYLDSLITLHQRKLEKLKTIKKSMLESMFV